MILLAALLAAASPTTCAEEAGVAQKTCIAVTAQKAGRFVDAATEFEAGAARRPGDPAGTDAGRRRQHVDCRRPAGQGGGGPRQGMSPGPAC